MRAGLALRDGRYQLVGLLLVQALGLNGEEADDDDGLYDVDVRWAALEHVSLDHRGQSAWDHTRRVKHEHELVEHRRQRREARRAQIDEVRRALEAAAPPRMPDEAQLISEALCCCCWGHVTERQERSGRDAHLR